MNRLPRFKKSGFTIIELLLVMLILASISGFLAVRFFGAYRRQGLESDTQKIVFTLRGARDKSINQEDFSQWGVHFDNSSSTASYSLFKGGSFATGTVVSSNLLSPGVDFSNPAEGSSADFIFSKLSGIPSAAGTVSVFLIDSPSSTKNIVINGNGTVDY